MVKLTEIKNMFWGLTLEDGKKYTRVLEDGFQLTMAALELNEKSKSNKIQVMFHQGTSDFLICTLQRDKQLQQQLDYSFLPGEEVGFSLIGSGIVHLTGYTLSNDDDGLSDDEADIPDLVDTSVDMPSGAGKRKRKSFETGMKKAKLELENDKDDDEDESEDPDYSEDDLSFFKDSMGDFDSDDDDEDDNDDDDEGDEDEFDESNEEEMESTDDEAPPAKSATPKMNNLNKGSQQKNTPKSNGKQTSGNTPNKKKQNSGNTPGKNNQNTQKSNSNEPKTPATNTPNSEAGSKKKNKKKKKNKSANSSMTEESGEPKPAKQDSTPKKKVVAGGTVVEELVVGNGPEAKAGKMVSIYYTGTLAKNNKQFDSCKSGKPFKFRLNQGEVIKGMDNGVLGMKVGGKRKLIIPANQGYGNTKQGPIPANSVLQFVLELKAVS